MDDAVTTVVRAFLALTPEEKVIAYLDIENAWRALQQEPEAPAPEAT
jgi:hypothetical protein